MLCNRLNSNVSCNPLGMLMPGRHASTATYRYGFNKMERDDEVKGGGNSYTTMFRQYDPRLGRWLSLDPMLKKFAWESPYAAMHNNPIWKKDPNGDCPDCKEKAVAAVKAVKSKINSQWKKSDNGAEEVKEYGGAIIERTKTSTEGTGTEAVVTSTTSYLTANVKQGGSTHAKIKRKGGEINNETDKLIGEFHTHPYASGEIKDITGGYPDWDGRGTGPSGEDFQILMTQAKSKGDGYFMAIESGNATYIMVVTDYKAFSKVYSSNNIAGYIDSSIDKAIYDKKNFNKDFPSIYETGMLEELNAAKSKNGSLGISILKSTNGGEFNTIF